MGRAEADVGAGAGDARATSTQPRRAACRRAVDQEITYPGRARRTAIRRRVGMQRQIGARSSSRRITSTRRAAREETVQNTNLSLQPGDRRQLPVHRHQPASVPRLGRRATRVPRGWSNYYGTDITFTKRFSDRWQASPPTRWRISRTDCRYGRSGISGSDGVMRGARRFSAGGRHRRRVQAMPASFDRRRRWQGRRPAPPRGAQRHLGLGYGVQVERHLLLRLG